jgi:hypothetical protein
MGAREVRKRALAEAAEKRFSRRMRQIEYLAITAAQQALVQTANSVISRARELCPVDTGYLRSSSFVDHPRRVGATLHVNLGFRAHYAAVVNARTAFFDIALSETMPELGDNLRANRQLITTLKPIRAEI